jgi:hypothetical protein
MQQSASDGSATLWEWCFHPRKMSCLACFWCCAYSVALCLCFCNFTLCRCNFGEEVANLFNASAVLLPAKILPWSAVASCWAAATTWDSSETVGLVIYWCLKKTVSLILVALVFVIYMRKQRWCCIDVPRLNPASDLVSQVRQSSGLTWASIAHPRGANGFFHVVVVAVDVRKYGCFWCYLRLAEEI